MESGDGSCCTPSERVELMLELIPLSVEVGSTARFGEGEMSQTTSSKASTDCR